MITNQESLFGSQSARIYTLDESENPNYQSAFMSNAQGSMDPTIESNYPELIQAAKKTLSSRKPIYDFNTHNKSFLNLYNDLYHLGIKNNKFFLRLYDKDLLGISPYQKILPVDLQLKILVEIMINPWYYLREVCRIPEDGSPIEIGGGTAYQIDRNNLATWYLYLNGIDYYGSKPRQTGKTQDAVAKHVYAYHFGTLSATFLYFNKDQRYAKDNLMRFKSQRDMLPGFLQMKMVYNEDGTIGKGIDNMTSMRNPITKNEIVIMPKATGKEAAMKLGRGNTAAFHYYDEFDFTPWNTEIIKAAVFSYSRASENAIKNHSLYGRTFTSTPGDLATRDGKAANLFIKQMVVWEDKYLDKPINQLKKIIRSEGHNGIVFVEHSWKQLKKSLAWYEKSCQDAGYDEDVILREIELKRFNSTSASPFKKSDLMYLSRRMKDPIREIDYSKNLCPIKVYEKLDRRYPYILSCDPSEGLAQDNNAMTLINPYTQRAAAEFRSPYISPLDMSKMIVTFMDDCCPNAMIVIESNRGQELISRIGETRYKYRLWYDAEKLAKPIVENTNEYGALLEQANQRRSLGFTTSRESRPKLYGVLENFMDERKDDIYTGYIVEDILALERSPNGRIAASDGNHDDNIMSYLFGLYVYFHASNLEEFGIRRGSSQPNGSPDDDSPKAQKEKIKGLLDSLPSEMREMFERAIAPNNDVDKAWEYQRQIELEEAKQQTMPGNQMLHPQDAILYPEQNDHAWDGIAQNAFESNFIHQEDVDIDNFI